MVGRVLGILAPNPGPFTLEGTNTWIVGADPAIVIDPGPSEPPHLEAVIDAAGPIGAILLTHHHLDHAPGAAWLAVHAGAPVLAARPELEEREVVDGAVIEAGGVSLRVVATPGHAPDHLAFLAEHEGWLFTGDAVLGRGTSVVDPPEGDMAAYLRSLEALRALRPQRLYPGHGPVVERAPEWLDEYLEHRRMRERQVVDALRRTKDPRSPAELASEIYAGYPVELLAAAARSVLAHLQKLQDEGIVSEDHQRFALAGPRGSSTT
jgi:glyoxylase-like metal-dependent hydrolase (beta-lactamase superfamily II)